MSDLSLSEQIGSYTRGIDILFGGMPDKTLEQVHLTMDHLTLRNWARQAVNLENLASGNMERRAGMCLLCEKPVDKVRHDYIFGLLKGHSRWVHKECARLLWQSILDSGETT